ncbi:MAG: hypothetical protein COA88_14565 [Kordia sp.]|nr:MAG: hypothetical protein COA88_14565 [Kordia sp.]
MRYATKIDIIDAMQLVPDNADELVIFCDGNIKSNPMVGVLVNTVHGWMAVRRKDYVVKDMSGRLIVLPENEFNMIYEPINPKK